MFGRAAPRAIGLRTRARLAGRGDVAARGISETLTFTRLGIASSWPNAVLDQPCESIIEIGQRNVKRWRDDDTRKGWTAAGVLVAEQHLRRIIGYRHGAKLVIAIERHADRTALRAATRTSSTSPSMHRRTAAR
jgi:hypothetical protein